MLFEFRCVNCDEVLRAETRFVGRMSRCPHCKNRLIVPALDDRAAIGIVHKDAEPAQWPQALGRPEPYQADSRPVLYITEDILVPRSVRETLRALLQWRVADVLRAIPIWGVSLALHLLVLLALTAIGVFALTTQKIAKRVIIPVKSHVVIADLPQQMQDVNLDRDATPDFSDVLLYTNPSRAPKGTAQDDFLGPAGSGESPAAISVRDPLANVVAAGTGRGTGVLGPGGAGSNVNYHGFQVGGARSVVFIVDASGSMLTGDIGKTRWDAAVNELRTSIHKLTFGHLFNIYFARILPGQQTFYERWKNTLVLTNPANKEDALAFIDRFDQEMRGLRKMADTGNFAFGAGTDILQATADAVKSNPDVIFLLSDAEFRELLSTGQNPADQIRAINRLHGAQIYTICFKERSGERIMKRIADENKGRYKFVP